MHGSQQHYDSVLKSSMHCVTNDGALCIRDPNWRANPEIAEELALVLDRWMASVDSPVGVGSQYGALLFYVDSMSGHPSVEPAKSSTAVKSIAPVETDKGVSDLKKGREKEQKKDK